MTVPVYKYIEKLHEILVGAAGNQTMGISGLPVQYANFCTTMTVVIFCAPFLYNFPSRTFSPLLYKSII